MLAVFTGLTFFGMGVVNVWLVISWLLGVTIFLSAGYYFYTMISSRAPVITFQSTGIVLHRKGDKYIAWDSIVEWKMRRDKSSYSLIIGTNEGKTRVSLDMLDRNAKQIEEMVKTYIRQPGPLRP